MICPCNSLRPMTQLDKMTLATRLFQTSPLLDLFLLEKSAYEICYEAANRPSWLGIPLRGFTEIASRILNVERETVDA